MVEILLDVTYTEEDAKKLGQTFLTNGMSQYCLEPANSGICLVTLWRFGAVLDQIIS